MGFFDNFKEKATDLMQAGAAQSKRLAEIAKLKTANMAEEDTIKKAYVELGKLYYAEKGATPEAAYAASCEKITAARAAIETNNERIAELKAKDPEDEDGGIDVEITVERDQPAGEPEQAAAEEKADEAQRAAETDKEEAAQEPEQPQE